MLSYMLCLEIHRNMMHCFRVQALQDPPFCSGSVICMYFCPMRDFVGVLMAVFLKKNFDIISFRLRFSSPISIQLKLNLLLRKRVRKTLIR
jgi:hypothetical protein